MRGMVVLVLLLTAMTAAAEELRTPADVVVDEVSLTQRLGEILPTELEFTDADGRSVQLADYFGERPVLLVPVWYSCPNLCGVILRGLEAALRDVDFSVGKDFQVVAVSVDPDDTTAKAAGIRDSLLRSYDRAGAEVGWHALTGEQAAIERFYAALGIGYGYDEESEQYAHPATIVLATPDGQISQYMPGVVFDPQSLRLALLSASQGQLGSLVDKVLLRCYHYDPATGQYSLLVLDLLRVFGSATVALIGGGVLLGVWRERRRKEADR